MPFTPISFESSRVKEAARKDVQEARERVLSRAKDDYDRRQHKVEEAKKRGDDKWMLPSVESRLASETSKKSKKHKKHKKKKKKKSKKHSSSDSSSESEDEWVEKVPKSSSSAPAPQQSSQQSAVVAAKTERDEWMTLPGLIPCVTRNELKKDSRQKQEEGEKHKFMLDRPGQSAQELNPYWRDGGTGLPQQQDEDLHLPEKTVGDQGSGWLRKALQRVHEQAAETGCSAEQIAAERWGSLEKLEQLLAEAEGRSRKPQDRRDDRRSSHDTNSRYRDNKDQDRRREKPKFARPSDDYDTEDRNKKSSRNQFEKPCDDDDYGSRRHSNSSERKRYHKPEESSRDRERPRFAKPAEESDTKRSSSRDHYSSSSRSSDDARRRDRDHNSSKETLSSKFLKPSVEDSGETSSYRQPAASSSGSRNWQKKQAKPASAPIKHRKPSPSSSSSESSDEEAKQVHEEPPLLLSDKDMNDIGAKIVKAEILGNTQLATELKQQLETARKAREEAKAAKAAGEATQEEEVVILTRTNAQGMTRPLEAPQYLEPSGGRRKKQKVETHNKEGQRERYFPDDDKYRLQDMFTKEKLNTVEDSNNEFARMISKGASRVGKGEYDLDDMFEEKARFKEPEGKMQAREREQAMREHHRVSRALEGCRWCLDSKQMLKHLIIAIGTKVYLSLPPYQSLTEGHCLLTPTLHSPCATQLDEDVWTEMQTFRKTLTRMFASKDQDVVFFETARNLRGFPHMVLECVPLDRESGNLAPIYFKKAIQECEKEWSTNKKLVELAGKGIRRSIPKGLPYFAVCFGDDDGFGHVIEEEKDFPHNFAQEIIGGILDLDHRLWRKRHNETFEAQRKKVLQFAKDWAPFDFTQKKKQQSSSSSSSDSD